MRELEKAENLNKFPEEYGKGELYRVSKFMKAWPYFFFSAIFFALGAAIILIYSFIIALVFGYA